MQGKEKQLQEHQEPRRVGIQRKAKSSWIRSAKDTGPQLPMHLKGRSGKSPTNVHLEVYKTSSGIQIFDLSTQRFYSNKGG